MGKKQKGLFIVELRPKSTLSITFYYFSGKYYLFHFLCFSE
jgi:hypothetical protein